MAVFMLQLFSDRQTFNIYISIFLLEEFYDLLFYYFIKIIFLSAIPFARETLCIKSVEETF